MYWFPFTILRSADCQSGYRCIRQLHICGIDRWGKYRLGFDYLPKFSNSYLGADNKSNVQLITAPACNASLGLAASHADCGSNPEIFSTCFVQGATNGANGTMETLLGIEYNFNGSSTPVKYAMHNETGSVWGLAWKSSSNELFSSAFVKQYSGLTQHGPGAIFKTKISGNTSAGTQLFAKLSDLGIDVGNLAFTDVTDCQYGTQVGKIDLGHWPSVRLRITSTLSTFTGSQS